MTILDSLLVSGFGLAMVFVVLIALSFIVMLQSKLFSLFTKQEKEDVASLIPATEAVSVDMGTTAGELKLWGVDEKTAAMIMAIVSDESQIPLSELRFLSIRALDE